jgi:hypothetical protein
MAHPFGRIQGQLFSFVGMGAGAAIGGAGPSQSRITPCGALQEALGRPDCRGSRGSVLSGPRDHRSSRVWPATSRRLSILLQTTSVLELVFPAQGYLSRGFLTSDITLLLRRGLRGLSLRFGKPNEIFCIQSTSTSVKMPIETKQLGYFSLGPEIFYLNTFTEPCGGTVRGGHLVRSG